MEISSGNDAAVSEFGTFVSDTCTESFLSECQLRGLLFSFKVLFFGVENASFGVVSGLLTAVLATGKAITARRMFGRVWIRCCTIREREESRSAAQTRASQYALSLTVTVMFLMGSPSGGTKRFPGLPSIYDCPRMDGNYLQNLAARLVGKRERAVGVRGLPSLNNETWGTQSWRSDQGNFRSRRWRERKAAGWGSSSPTSQNRDVGHPPNFIGQMWAIRQQCLGALSFACFAKGGKPDTPAVIGAAREPSRFVVSHPPSGSLDLSRPSEKEPKLRLPHYRPKLDLNRNYT